MTDTLNLPELPEPDVYRDDHPFGGPPEWFSDDAMRAYATAAVLAERESRWRPIETAPRDGSLFLGWRRNDLRVSSAIVDEGVEVWRFGNEYAIGQDWPLFVPTHWMPLPEPPKESE